MSSELNPTIQTVKIGVTSLSEKTLYPLSIADQLKVTELVGDIIDGISDDRDVEKLSDTEIVQKFCGSIEKNIEEVLGYVSGGIEGNVITLNDLTNPQLAEIIESIFIVNYESSIKNLTALWKRAKGLFLLEK